MSVRSEIIAQVTQVAKEQDKHLAPLADDLELVDSGLDSLCMAVIVARLEDALGVDPIYYRRSCRFPGNLGRVHQFLRKCRKVMRGIALGRDHAAGNLSDRFLSGADATVLWALWTGILLRWPERGIARPVGAGLRPGTSSPRP